MRLGGFAFGILLLLATAGCGGGGSSVGPTPPPVIPPTPPPATASPDVRADFLMGQMTLDEKLQLVHGGAATD
jgi:hypothetical protein